MVQNNIVTRSICLTDKICDCNEFHVWHNLCLIHYKSYKKKPLRKILRAFTKVETKHNNFTALAKNPWADYCPPNSALHIYR